MATSTTVVLVRYQDPFDVRERGAVAGFLAGYTGSTRVNYTTDIRLFACWCTEVGVRVVGGTSAAMLRDQASTDVREVGSRLRVAQVLGRSSGDVWLCANEGVFRTLQTE